MLRNVPFSLYLAAKLCSLFFPASPLAMSAAVRFPHRTLHTSRATLSPSWRSAASAARSSRQSWQARPPTSGIAHRLSVSLLSVLLFQLVSGLRRAAVVSRASAVRPAAAALPVQRVAVRQMSSAHGPPDPTPHTPEEKKSGDTHRRYMRAANDRIAIRNRRREGPAERQADACIARQRRRWSEHCSRDADGQWRTIVVCRTLLRGDRHDLSTSAGCRPAAFVVSPLSALAHHACCCCFAFVCVCCCVGPSTAMAWLPSPCSV